MASNADIEMRWIDAWSRLYELVGDRRDVPCQLPDWSIVNVEKCKGWLQERVYQGQLVGVEAGWVGHRQGIIVSTRDDRQDAV